MYWHLISWMLPVASVFWKRGPHMYPGNAMKIAPKEILSLLGVAEQMTDGYENVLFTTVMIHKKKYDIWALLTKWEKYQIKDISFKNSIYNKTSSYVTPSVLREWKSLGQYYDFLPSRLVVWCTGSPTFSHLSSCPWESNTPSLCSGSQ